MGAWLTVWVQYAGFHIDYLELSIPGALLPVSTSFCRVGVLLTVSSTVTGPDFQISSVCNKWARKNQLFESKWEAPIRFYIICTQKHQIFIKADINIYCSNKLLPPFRCIKLSVIQTQWWLQVKEVSHWFLCHAFELTISMAKLYCDLFEGSKAYWLDNICIYIFM